MELESILLPGIEAKRPIVIAGPCSAETEEQVMDTAKQLAAKGQKIYAYQHLVEAQGELKKQIDAQDQKIDKLIESRDELQHTDK